MMISTEVTNRPNAVPGAMSPKPTVAIVTTAQYMPVGMLVKPCAGPSITYISAPKITVMVSRVAMNTAILRRLRTSDWMSTPASLEYSTSFSTRKIRSRRSARITVSDALAGNSSDRKVGRIARRSIAP